MPSRSSRPHPLGLVPDGTADSDERRWRLDATTAALWGTLPAAEIDLLRMRLEEGGASPGTPRPACRSTSLVFLSSSSSFVTCALSSGTSSMSFSILLKRASKSSPSESLSTSRVPPTAPDAPPPTVLLLVAEGLALYLAAV